ncbi:MAG: Nucleoside-diphosphate-sugar epimerase-like protein [Frankiales bacterium]|nr:Nucleoside-diphosphate-sugar epimerase-like protein [Frankiales bacterium]
MTVRPERTALDGDRARAAAGTGRPPVVAVTGAASGLGRAVVERLAGRDDVGGLVGVDVEGAPVDGVVWRLSDVRDPLLAGRLHGVDVLVHLATSYDVALDAGPRRALNVRGTALALEAARTAGVRRVVLATSADVYGALPDNAVPLADGAPLRAAPDDVTLTGDHVEVERLADHAVRTGLDVVVLRPATLVGGGLGPAYDGQQLRQLSGTRLLATRGHEPLWQLCHVDDLGEALVLAALGGVDGGQPVASVGWLEQARVEVLTGKRRLELPPAVALSTADRLHRYGVVHSSRRELDQVLAPLVVHPQALLDAGWAPAWSNEDALAAHLASRGPDSRAGAVGAAAGAAAALVTTAALVRATRRKRRRRR